MRNSLSTLDCLDRKLSRFHWSSLISRNRYIYSKMLIEMLIKRNRNCLWNRTVRVVWTSAPNVQAVRRVLTASRSVELFGFPPIPYHSMRLRPPRMHPYLMRKKVIHCKTRHRIITRNGTSASNEEGWSYNSTEFR